MCSDHEKKDDGATVLLQAVLILVLGGALYLGEALGLPPWVIEWGSVIVGSIADDD